MLSNSKLSTILKALMNEVKITVTELARQTGIGQPVIHRMASGETDNPKVGSLSPIAKFFNVNISQLIGDEPLPSDRISGSHNPYYRSWSKLPLLSWEQATGWPDRVTHHEVFSYVSTESNVTEQAFAVKVEDNTMDPRYPEGTLLIIEPSLQVHDKDFALVHVEGQKKAQFKQVLFDGEDLYLKPINKDFEIKKVDREYSVLGVMVQSLTEYYQDRLPPGEEEALDSKPPVKKRKDKAFADIED